VVSDTLICTFEELPMSYDDPQPTLFTQEENDALTTFSAEYSAGLNGSGPVNKFRHAKERNLLGTR
jgi:hypothetical protein